MIFTYIVLGLCIVVVTLLSVMYFRLENKNLSLEADNAQLRATIERMQNMYDSRPSLFARDIKPRERTEHG